MIRNAKFLKHILGISPTTVIHIGADQGQDRDAYKSLGAKKIYWCEANPNSAKELKDRYPEDTVIEALFLETPRSNIPFYQTEFSAQNSAIAPLKNSEIQVKSVLIMNSTTVDLKFSNLKLNNPIMVVIDVQGAEEQVLQGGNEFLSKVKYISIEIALSPQGYSYTPSETSIDFKLKRLGFRKSIFRLGRTGIYKDQFYIRSSILRTSYILVIDNFFDFFMRTRHKILFGHSTKVHYHCEECGF